MNEGKEKEEKIKMTDIITWEFRGSEGERGRGKPGNKMEEEREKKRKKTE